MTIEERKRAKLLEKVSIVYSANKSGTLVAVLMAILLAVLDLTLYFFGFKDEYTADLLIVHNLMVYIFMGIFANLPTNYMGAADTNNGTVYAEQAADANMKFGSTIYTGKLYSTMPFSAKDVQHLRLINWEKQLAASAVVTLLLQLTVMLSERNGAEIHHGAVGYSVIGFILAEAALFFISTLWLKKYAILINSIGVSFVTLPVIKMVKGDFEHISENAERLAFLSGSTGIAVTVILSAVLVIFAEIWIKHRKIPSWNMN